MDAKAWEEYVNSIKSMGPFIIGQSYKCLRKVEIPLIAHFKYNDIDSILKFNVEEECFTAKEAEALKSVVICTEGLLYLPEGTVFNVLKPKSGDLNDGSVRMQVIVNDISIELSMMLDTPIYEDFGLRFSNGGA